MAGSFICQISFELDGQKKRLLIDTVEDTRIDSRVTMTMHPIVTGDMVADHIYKEADTLSLNGQFSLNAGSTYRYGYAEDKLARIQTMFERIKDEGILCDIVKMPADRMAGIRFKHHSNMVLTGISWTEKINSLGFSFTFTQALIAEIQTPAETQIDAYLPSITQPQQVSFTDEIIDWNAMSAKVDEIMESNGLATKEFWNYMQSIGKDTAITIALSVGIPLVVSAFTLPATAVFTVAAGVAALILLFTTKIYNATRNLINSKDARKLQFKYYKDDEQMRKEVERYITFKGNIMKDLYLLNDAIQVFRISRNDEQKCLLNIDNNYYWFEFNKRWLGKVGDERRIQTYSLRITDAVSESEDVIKTVNSVSAQAASSFFDCNPSNALFRVSGTGKYVFLAAIDDEQSRYDLTNYYIITSTINPEEFDQKIEETIKNSLES